MPSNQKFNFHHLYFRRAKERKIVKRSPNTSQNDIGSISPNAIPKVVDTSTNQNTTSGASSTSPSGSNGSSNGINGINGLNQIKSEFNQINQISQINQINGGLNTNIIHDNHHHLHQRQISYPNEPSVLQSHQHEQDPVALLQQGYNALAAGNSFMNAGAPLTSSATNFCNNLSGQVTSGSGSRILEGGVTPASYYQQAQMLNSFNCKSEPSINFDHPQDQ